MCGAVQKNGETHTHSVIGTVEQVQMPVPKTHKYTPPPKHVTAADDAGLEARPQ